MSVTISRLYDDYASASAAVTELERRGIARDDISIVSNNADSWYKAPGKHDRDRDGVDDRAEGAAAGAGIGATVGGVAGLLAGLGMLAIPGLGPVVAAGWLVSTAAVAAVGGAAGGIVGALVESGVDKDAADIYAEGVRRGGSLVVARVPDADRATYEAVLDRSAVSVGDRAAAYRKAGWSKFDTAAPPLSPEELRRERDLYRTRL